MSAHDQGNDRGGPSGGNQGGLPTSAPREGLIGRARVQPSGTVYESDRIPPPYLPPPERTPGLTEAERGEEQDEADTENKSRNVD